jgi:hypothetical protein
VKDGVEEGRGAILAITGFGCVRVFVFGSARLYGEKMNVENTKETRLHTNYL